ncbi:MAG: fibronectin type III domain-containing protein [Prevotella sp.]|nr:fibronectin type III domain-containing protein [Prevotella sp.]
MKIRRNLLARAAFTLLAMLCFIGARADVVEIGDGGTTNNTYLPGYNYYNYSYTQQIYTAEEIGTAGTINSIAFKNTGAEKSRTYNIYFKLTDKASFSGGTDWVAMSDEDLVFSGELDFPVGEWTTIQLDAPFAYDGESNLIVAVADVSGDYSSSPHMACLVFTATGQAIRAYRDSGAYDITNPAASGSVLNVKNQIQLDITAGAGPTCAKPKNLAVNYTGGTTAEVTWTGEANSYDIDVNGTVTTGVSSPYTLQDLDLATIYQVKVRSNCGGDDYSDWTSAVSFTTDICTEEDQCVITFELSDSYGDGWNGNAIQVVDVETNKVLGEVTIASGSSGTFTLGVCPDREIKFVWVKGSYGNETSWVIRDLNGEEITSGEGNTSMATGEVLDTYTVSCKLASCVRPTELAAVGNPTDQSVQLSWTPGSEDQRAWDVAYKTEDDKDFTIIEGVEANPYTLEGLDAGTYYTIKVRGNCGDGDVSAWSDEIEIKTAYCPEEEQCLITYELHTTSGYEEYGWYGAYLLIYDVETGTLVDYLTVPQNSSKVTGSVAVCSGRDIAFGWYAGSYDSYLIDKIIVKDVNGDEILNTTGALSDYVYYTVDCTVSDCHKPTDLTASQISGTSAKLSWTENGEATAWVIAYMAETDEEVTEIEVDENPYTLTGLDPETTYYAMVRPACDENVEKWSDVISFMTDERFAVPQDLTVDNVLATTADVSWTSFGVSDELQYAILPENSDLLQENQYDDGTLKSNIGMGGGSFSWGVMFPTGSYTGDKLATVSIYDILAMDGTITIYNGGATAPENAIKTKAISLTGANKFVDFSFGDLEIDPTKNLWVIVTNASGATYPAAVSADSKNDPNGRWVELDGEWMDLAEAGISGSCFMIHAITHGDLSSLDWTIVENANSTQALTGLTPESNYVVRVQSDYGEGISGWAMTTFTTLAATTPPFDLSTTNITKEGATLNWSGAQDSYTVRYRTAAVCGDETTFFDDFEDGLGQWTTIRNGEGTENTDWHTFDATNFDGGSNHSGDAVAMSRSWASQNAYSVDNWLITPQVSLDGILKFWVMDDGQYHEHYDIYVSTTGNTIADFGDTPFFEPGNATGTWKEVSVDLTSFGGAEGYIAIRHTDTDQDFLLIDDFGIYAIETPAGEWQTINTTDTSVDLTGLTEDTEYQWQVQGASPVTEWSEMVNFWTGAEIVLENDEIVTDVITEYMERTVDVKLNNRTIYRDATWNTICLPFDVDLTDPESPLYGATAKTFSDATITGTHVDIDFSEPQTELIAGVPYILRWTEAQATNLVNPVFEGVTISANDSYMMYNSDYSVFFVGNFDPVYIDPAEEPDDLNIYYMTANSTLKHSEVARTLKSLRAYFFFHSTDDGSAKDLTFTLNFGDDATGIQTIDGDVRKAENDSWFTLDGAKLSGKPTKRGVYLNNGRKVVIK